MPKSRMEKPRLPGGGGEVKSMLIRFFDVEGITYYKFVPPHSQPSFLASSSEKFTAAHTPQKTKSLAIPSGFCIMLMQCPRKNFQ
jgi:hypothetical protein